MPPKSSGHAVIRALALLGFVAVGQKGSHVKLRHFDGRVVIVPLHRELAAGTLSPVCRQASVSVDELRKRF